MARLKNLTDRGKDTQRELRNALVQLILEKGFEKVTIKDITDLTGLDRSTFYLHYKDKAELLEQSQKQLVDDLLERSKHLPNPGDGILVAFQHMHENAAFYRSLLQVEGDFGINQRLHNYLAERIGERLRERAGLLNLTTTVPIELLANYFASALRGTGMWWLAQENSYTPEEMAAIFQRLMLQGLSAGI